MTEQVKPLVVPNYLKNPSLNLSDLQDSKRSISLFTQLSKENRTAYFGMQQSLAHTVLRHLEEQGQTLPKNADITVLSKEFSDSLVARNLNPYDSTLPLTDLAKEFLEQKHFGPKLKTAISKGLLNTAEAINPYAEPALEKIIQVAQTPLQPYAEKVGQAFSNAAEKIADRLVTEPTAPAVEPFTITKTPREPGNGTAVTDKMRRLEEQRSQQILAVPPATPEPPTSPPAPEPSSDEEPPNQSGLTRQYANHGVTVTDIGIAAAESKAPESAEENRRTLPPWLDLAEPGSPKRELPDWLFLKEPPELPTPTAEKTQTNGANTN